MTPLETKVKRDAYGIDTFERGFVYAALLLRASNTDPANPIEKSKNKYYGAVKLAFDFGGESMSIQMKLPYNSREFLKEGADCFLNLGEYGNNNPNPLLVKVPASNPKKLQIPTEPSWVLDLERYAAWCAKNIICGYRAMEDAAVPVTLAVNEEDAVGASMMITARLGFDYGLYLVSNSVLAAIKSVIEVGCGAEVSTAPSSSTGSSGPSTQPAFAMGNIANFGNSFNFGN